MLDERREQQGLTGRRRLIIGRTLLRIRRCCRKVHGGDYVRLGLDGLFLAALIAEFHLLC